eukprot:gene11967-12110_t
MEVEAGVGKVAEMPTNTGITTHSSNPACRWHPLVDQELAAEQALVKERLSSWPLQRLVREGLVLLGLTAAKRGSFFGTPVWVMRPATRGVQLPFHRFV